MFWLTHLFNCRQRSAFGLDIEVQLRFVTCRRSLTRTLTCRRLELEGCRCRTATGSRQRWRYWRLAAGRQPTIGTTWVASGHWVHSHPRKIRTSTSAVSAGRTVCRSSAQESSEAGTRPLIGSDVVLSRVRSTAASRRTWSHAAATRRVAVPPSHFKRDSCFFAYFVLCYMV